MPFVSLSPCRQIMQLILNIIQVIIASLLIAAILLQRRGAGLGAGFGGEGNIYFQKRGMEKTLFILTIVFSVLFLGVAFANLLLV